MQTPSATVGADTYTHCPSQHVPAVATPAQSRTAYCVLARWKHDMRGHLLRLKILGIVALMVAAMVIVVWIRSPKPLDKTSTQALSLNARAVHGKALFESRCASCHSVEQRAAPLLEAADRGVARKQLLVFLEGHGHSSSAENPPIVDFLADAVPPARPR